MKNKLLLIHCVFAFTICFSSCKEKQSSNKQIQNDSIPNLQEEVTETGFTPILNSKYFPDDIATLYFDNQAHYVYNNGVFIESFPFYDYVDNAYTTLRNFHEGVAVVTKRYKADSGYGFEFDCIYVDSSGEKIIDEVFGHATDFKNGYARTTLKSHDENEWCLIDKVGRHIIEADEIGEPYQNFVWIKSANRWGLAEIDTKKQSHTMITEFSYKITGDFIDGICWVKDYYSEKRAYMNVKGELLTPWYDNATDLSNNFATFEAAEKWGAIDKSGKVIIAPQFDYLSNFSEGLAGFCSIKNGDFEKWGYIDQTGKVIIEKNLGWATNFVNGYAIVRKDNSEGLRGFINKKGILIADYSFEEAHNFYEGYAAVKKNGKYGFIDTTGKLVIDYKYDEIAPFPNNPFEAGFSGGVVKVIINEDESFVNKNGDCLLGCNIQPIAFD